MSVFRETANKNWQPSSEYKLFPNGNNTQDKSFKNIKPARFFTSLICHKIDWHANCVDIQFKKMSNVKDKY